MSTYKLLALDMDGTLLTSEKRISRRTLDALHDATDRGVRVALSTGRALVEVGEYRRELRGAVRYASLLSGAQTYDLERDASIDVVPFDTPTALAIAEQGQAEDAMVVVLTSQNSFVRERDICRLGELGLGVYEPLYRQVSTPCDDLLEAIRSHPGSVCKVNLYHHDHASRLRSRDALGGTGAQLSFSEASSLECTPAGVSKASGLKALCDHLGCTLDECVVVGDGLNDLDVLAAAGLAVAMGNAQEQVRACADEQVADNDHDGIAEAVARWFS